MSSGEITLCAVCITDSRESLNGYSERVRRDRQGCSNVESANDGLITCGQSGPYAERPVCRRGQNKCDIVGVVDRGASVVDLNSIDKVSRGNGCIGTPWKSSEENRNRRADIADGNRSAGRDREALVNGD